jgi:PKD repeat protein
MGDIEMKNIWVIGIVIVVLFSGMGASVLSRIISADENTKDFSSGSCDDLSTYRYAAAMNTQDVDSQTTTDGVVSSNSGARTEYPIGTMIWQYQITGGYDTSPKAIASIPDISGDGIDDVIICSEDNYVRCFSGAAIGTGAVLWSHEIYSGNIYSQHGLTITQDINNDGYHDVVVGATGGARLIQCISGQNGNTLWTHDTHEYGDGGWVYQVDCRYDYNNDGVLDVLAATGDDSSGTGPNRVYCLNGLTGVSLWERPLGGPGFAVMGVADFTGDGVADVLAGCSNDAESTGYGKGINGATGAQMWSFTASGSSVWAVEQLDDASGDGIPDVIIGDFSGHIYGLNAATGAQHFTRTIGSAIITRFEQLDDVNGDGHPDIIPAHSSTSTTQVLDGMTGELIWSHSVSDQPWNVAPCTDISGDAIDDVFVGTLYQNNYAYFLNGVDGSELTTPISYGQAVDAIAAVSDETGDASMEMVVGGRDGKVTCYSGGLNSSVTTPRLHAGFTADQTNGFAPFTVHFTDLSVAENTTITSWKWDFNHDGTIDSTEKSPIWTYQTAGNFTVSLTVSDGHISDTEIKDQYITVHELVYDIVITNVTSGFLRLNAVIENQGTIDVGRMNWSISVTGGFIFLGKTATGSIVGLTAGSATTISDKLLLGFGKVVFTITVVLPDGSVVTKSVGGILLLFIPIIQ